MLMMGGGTGMVMHGRKERLTDRPVHGIVISTREGGAHHEHREDE